MASLEFGWKVRAHDAPAGAQKLRLAANVARRMIAGGADAAASRHCPINRRDGDGARGSG
jgi:hypothetical protein